MQVRQKPSSGNKVKQRVGGGTRKKIQRGAERHLESQNRQKLSVGAIVPQKQELDYLRQEVLRAPSIQEIAKTQKEIRHFIRRELKSGIDYDMIPGTGHKTLYQPGAEKIARWLKVKPLFDKVETDLPNGHVENVIRCHLLPLLILDLVLKVIESRDPGIEKAAEAIIKASELSNAEASCTSMETNFRYLWADMRDENGDPLKPEKHRAAQLTATNMGRWIPAKMKSGKIVAMTHADKKKGMPAEYFLWQERVEHPNPWDQRNKVRQQGEKRAFVKAIRRMAAISEIFQEDPNEWPETLDVKPEKPPEEPFVAGRVERNEPAQPKAQAAKPQGNISIIWQDKDVARVAGDVASIKDQLLHQLNAFQLHGKEEFIVQAVFIPPLFELCARPEVNLKVTETQMKSEHKPRPASDACVEESGTIKNVKQGGGKTLHAQVLFNGAWLYCYSKTLWGFLFAGVGKDARILVNRKEGRAPVIEGLLQVGTTRFAEDGKTVAA